MIYEAEYECSRFTPGAYWVHGAEYWEVKVRYRVPDDCEDPEEYIDSHPDPDSLIVEDDND